MNTGGWIIMILSVGAVVGLFGWCLTKVLSTPGSTGRLHAQTDIDPRDSDT